MQFLLRLLALLFAMGLATPAPAQTRSASEAQVAWRLLDYVAVDYAGAVANGQVTNAAEYGEMVEFGGQIRTRLDALPSHPAKASLLRDAVALQAAIRDKRAPGVVGDQAKALAAAVLMAYPFLLGPSIAAIAMSGSSALVAINALMLKRTRLTGIRRPGEAVVAEPTLTATAAV